MARRHSRITQRLGRLRCVLVCNRRRTVGVSRSVQRINGVRSRRRERFSGSCCTFGGRVQPLFAANALVTESG
jgi:hypothetical protein